MDNVELITGQGLTNHVDSEDDGLIHAYLYGDARYILYGCECSITDANTLHVNPGLLLIDGRFVRIKEPGVDLNIKNGTQSVNRIDLVVIRYTEDTSGNEDSPLIIIDGTPAEDPVTPTYIDGSILDPEDTTVEIPLCKYTVTGIVPGTPEMLITANLNNLEALLGAINDINDIFDNAVPVAQGGTGAKTAAQALINFGLSATAKELNYTDGVTSNIQTQLNAKAATSTVNSLTSRVSTLESNWNNISQIQTGIIEGFSIGYNTSVVKTVTFPQAFSSVPTVIPFIFSGSDTMNIGMLQLGVDRNSITRTSCKIRYYNASAGLNYTPSIMWIAIPQL